MCGLGRRQISCLALRVLRSVANFTRRDAEEFLALAAAILGELAAAVRRHGMRMGLYYSGGIDWSFNDTLVDRPGILRTTAVPQTASFCGKVATSRSWNAFRQWSRRVGVMA